MPEFLDISYLAEGNPRQRRCCEILRQTRVMEILAPYDPILTGTIPIGIDIPSSDLDIVCEVHDAENFTELLREKFDRYDSFDVRVNGGTVVCGFRAWHKANGSNNAAAPYFGYSSAGGELIEIFGSPVPSVQNNAYRHMLVEYRLLTLFGENLRRRVVELKSGGLKTEPAFARLLGLGGDPYDALLEIETMTDERLVSSFHG